MVLALLWSPEPGEETLVFSLGHLGKLPRDQPLVVDQEGQDIEQETVSHVDNTANLDREHKLFMRSSHDRITLQLQLKLQLSLLKLLENFELEGSVSFIQVV